MEYNNQIISKLYEDYNLKSNFQNLIIDGLTKKMESFPIDTTYEPDLILPKYLGMNDLDTN